MFFHQHQPGKLHQVQTCGAVKRINHEFHSVRAKSETNTVWPGANSR